MVEFVKATQDMTWAQSLTICVIAVSISFVLWNLIDENPWHW